MAPSLVEEDGQAMTSQWKEQGARGNMQEQSGEPTWVFHTWTRTWKVFWEGLVSLKCP